MIAGEIIFSTVTFVSNTNGDSLFRYLAASGQSDQALDTLTGVANTNGKSMFRYLAASGQSDQALDTLTRVANTNGKSTNVIIQVPGS